MTTIETIEQVQAQLSKPIDLAHLAGVGSFFIGVGQFFYAAFDGDRKSVSLSQADHDLLVEAMPVIEAWQTESAAPAGAQA